MFFSKDVYIISMSAINNSGVSQICLSIYVLSALIDIAQILTIGPGTDLINILA